MTLEAFQNHFYNEYNHITDLLNDLNKDDKLSDQEQKQILSIAYEAISNRTELLQKYYTENTAFIPVYEVRKAQDYLSKLNRLAQEKRDQLFPKKKFGFKSKQNMVTLETAIETASNKKAEVDTSTPNDKSADICINSSCTIRDFNNETCIKNENEINGKDIALINLKNTTVIIYGNPSVLHVSDLENVIVLCGPITGSAFISNCKNCKLVVGCHQLRIHDSQNTQFYINVGSRAIIENCSKVFFAEYSWRYPNIERHFDMSGLKINQSNLTCIDDFNWLNQTQKSPHWDFLEESKRIKWITNDKGELNTISAN